jgi:hypothetical protein
MEVDIRELRSFEEGNVDGDQLLLSLLLVQVGQLMNGGVALISGRKSEILAEIRRA